MKTLIRFRALCLCLLFGLLLAACGNNDAEQRKAFVEFLQTRVLDRPGVRVPAPSEEQKKAFGDYAKHYAVITDFNEGMNKSVGEPMKALVGKGTPRSIGEFVSRRDELKAARESLAALRTALGEQLAKADAAHAALKQPDDLKPVYDKAYEKTVTNPASIFKDVFPALDKVFETALAIGDYMEQNKSKIQVTGTSIAVSDPAVQAQLGKMLQELNGQAGAIQAAQRRMQGAVQGP